MVPTVVAGLAGVTLGLTPLLVLIGMAFTGSVDIGWSPLLVYAVSGLLAYGISVAAVFGVLRAAGGIDLLFARRERSRRCFRSGGVGGDCCGCRYCVEAGLFHRRSHLDCSRTAGGARIGRDVRCGPGVGTTDAGS